jgi:Tfp pilus assembly protein PilV
MQLSRLSPFRHERGVTILEVLASAVLILLGLSAIFAINSQSLQILRRTQQAAAASQILQERIEAIRTHAWPEVARARALATWWQTPTFSAPGLADADPTETLTVQPVSSPNGTPQREDSFIVKRSAGRTAVVKDGDFTGDRLLLVEVTIRWREQKGMAERKLRTIVGRAGLTRSGIFGSAFGRVARETGEGATP